MKEKASELSQRIAQRTRELRAQAGFSLDALAGKSGVSRSMLSLIERGETSPTAVILEKLAGALGTTLGALFEPDGSAEEAGGPLARRGAQIAWRDPQSGYVRRNISPPGLKQPMRIVEVSFPAGGRVAFETGERETRVYQQIWLLKGAMEITVGHERHSLREGDCLAMELDRPTLFHNRTRRTARYAVVIASEMTLRR